ncbi:MAG: PAS domain S-box protein [Nitrospirae bacterium]|nr:PAS domain S-box protein [Nitrospirota bacterium]
MKTKIIIVEDEVIVAEDIRTTLMHLDYDVIAMASSGEEAVVLAGEFKPDIVMMDIILKGSMDGIEAATQIQSKYDIPVIYLTAHGDENTFERAKVSAPFGYLMKPFDVQMMKNTIEMAIYKHGVEKKLKESEARYRAIVEDQTELISRFLPNGVLTFVNDTFCRHFNKRADELIGENVINLIIEEDRERLRKQIDFLSPDMPVVMSENRILRQNGMVAWLQCTLRAIFDDYFHKAEIQAVYRDITERKRTEEKLRAQEEVLSLLIDYTPAAVALFDLDMKCIVASKRWVKNYGLGSKNVIGMAIYEILSSYGDNWKSAFTRCIEGAAEKCEEEMIKLPDGRTEWMRWEMRPWVRHDNSVGGVIMFNEIVTELKQTKIKLDELNRDFENKLAKKITAFKNGIA